jgi:hypothetical protein
MIAAWIVRGFVLLFDPGFACPEAAGGIMSRLL